MGSNLCILENKYKRFYQPNEEEEIEVENLIKSRRNTEQIINLELNAWEEKEINCGIIGSSGSGKSSFINAIRNMRGQDAGAAQVGYKETTLVPTVYKDPRNSKLLYWDLPGVGTPTHPKDDSYLETVEFQKYDCFIIVSSTRFTEKDLWLAKKIQEKGKKFYFVRAKLDCDVENGRYDYPDNFDEENLLGEIREFTAKKLMEGGIHFPKIFLISNHHQEKYDFPKLRNEILNTLQVRAKRDAMILSIKNETEVGNLPSSSEETELSKVMKLKLNEWKEAEVNCAIIGSSGSGKSSFINAIRNMRGQDEGAAEVGCNETTLDPTPYKDRRNPKLVYWDLPGVGTPNHPKDDSYLETVEFEKYDCFIIVSSDRFTEDDMWLANKIQEEEKKFLFIRTKLDRDLRDHKHEYPDNFVEENVLREICKYTALELMENGIHFPKVFLISNHHQRSYDFPKLIKEISNSLQGRAKRDAMILSVSSFSRQIIVEKKKTLKKRIHMVAALSAACALVPFPGVALVADIALLVNELKVYVKCFGLTEDNDGLDAANLAYIISLASAQTIVGTMAPLIGVVVVEEVLRFIPLLGLFIGSGISYAATYLMLYTQLEKLETIAVEVMERKFTNCQEQQEILENEESLDD